MSNRFNIDVVANDRFTRVFRHLNDQASKAMRPLTNTQRQLGALFRELHIPQVLRGVTAVSRGAQQMAANLGAAAAPLQSLFGIGAAGGLAGATAAAAAVVATWSRSGAEVKRTATAIGLSTDELQRWRGGAELAGVQADAMTSALANLGMTLRSVANGTDPDAGGLLVKLGIGLRRDANGLLDVAATMDDIGRALSRIDSPQTRQAIASAFGIEQALPYLIRGAEEMARLREEAAKTGVVMGADAIERAERLARAWDRLGLAATGLRNRLADGWGLDTMMNNAADAMSPSQPQPPPTPGELEALRGRFKPFGGKRPNRGSAEGVWDGDTGHAPGLSRRIGDWRDDAQMARDAEAVRIIRGERDATSDPSLKASMAREIERLGGKVEITVNIPNAPAGTTVTANSSGPPVRIGASGEW